MWGHNPIRLVSLYNKEECPGFSLSLYTHSHTHTNTHRKDFMKTQEEGGCLKSSKKALNIN